MADSLDQAFYELTGVTRTERHVDDKKDKIAPLGSETKPDGDNKGKQISSDEILEYIENIKIQLSTLEDLLKESN